MAQLGTLVVVIIKARNLTNKVKLGKQNPYTTITYGLTKKRTTAIERGGQNPEWDEEFRFDIPSDLNDFATGQEASVTRSGGVEQLKGPGKEAVIVKKDLARVLRVACYADDSRDPKLLGEAKIELEDVLKKGTFDDWVTLQYKSRDAGELYIEMTFYSNAPPPSALTIRKMKSTAVGANYGGPGVSVDDGDFGGNPKRLSVAGNGTGTGSRNNSYSSRRSPSPIPDLGDYPDADFGPLASTFSSMSLRKQAQPIPLPTPVPRTYSQNRTVSSNTLPPPQYHPQDQNYDYGPPLQSYPPYSYPAPPSQPSYPSQYQPHPPQQHEVIQQTYPNHPAPNYYPPAPQPLPPPPLQYQQPMQQYQEYYQDQYRSHEPERDPEPRFEENNYQESASYYNQNPQHDQARPYNDNSHDSFTPTSFPLPPQPPVPPRNYTSTPQYQNPPSNLNHYSRQGTPSIHSPIPTLPPPPPPELASFVDAPYTYAPPMWNGGGAGGNPPLPPLPPTFYESGPRGGYEPYPVNREQNRNSSDDRGGWNGQEWR